MKRIVIIGAGLTGLSVAYHLKRPNAGLLPLSLCVLEKSSRPGGLCKTEEEKGFHFDYTGHLLHFRTSYFRDLVKKLLGQNLSMRYRSAWIYSKGVYTRYPFQANLYGLPEKVAIECLYEYCKAYFTDKSNKAVNSFYDWINCNFGRGIARHFMIPYNQKLWRRHPREITCNWLNRFVPKPDLKQVIQGTISSRVNSLGYNAKFYYPNEGGIESLVKPLAEDVDSILTNQEVSRINLRQRRVYTARGEVFPFDILVSTLPITEFVSMLDSKPLSVQQAAGRLKHVSVLNINFGIKQRIARKHWVYVPEKEFLFYRIGFPHNFSESTVVPGHGSIYTEISYDPQKGIDATWARNKVVKDIMHMGLVRNSSQIIAEKIIDIPHAYVIFDKERDKSLSLINNYLENQKVFSIGRYGAWKYSSMEDAVLDGKETAASIIHICQDSMNRKTTGCSRN